MSNYSVFSETSAIESQYDNLELNQSGGFLNNIFGQNNNKYENLTDLINGSINECNINVTDFLLGRRFVPDLSRTDHNGNNLLHNLIMAHTKRSQLAYKALTFIISSDISGLKSALNTQNKQGDTPLHCAIRAELDTIVSLMMMKGAKKIKNNDGFEPETEMERSETLTVITVSGSDKDLRGLLGLDDEESVLERTDLDTFSMTDSRRNRDIPKMQTILEDTKLSPEMADKKEESIFSTQDTDYKSKPNKTPELGLMTEEDGNERNNVLDLLKEFERYTKNTNSMGNKRVMGKTPEQLIDSQGVGTEEFNDYLSKKGTMTGGTRHKKMITGHRVMRKNTDSEYYDQFGGESEKLDNEPDIDDVGSDSIQLYDINVDLNRLARDAVNQKGKLHEEALEKIMKHLKKKDKSEINAKTIKALIYGNIKKEMEELGGLDRAMEMVKRITEKEVQKLLKSKEFTKLKVIIEKKTKEREEKLKARKSKSTKSTESAKSSDQSEKNVQARMISEDEYMDTELGGDASDSDYMREEENGHSDDSDEEVDSENEDLPVMNQALMENLDSNMVEFIEDKSEGGEISEEGDILTELPTMRRDNENNVEETSMLSSLVDTDKNFNFF